jgi:hypothetical protein
MENILAQITALPGVIGAGFLQPGTESQYAGKQKRQLRRLSMHTAMLFGLGSSKEFPFDCISYRFDHSTIAGLALEKKALLIIACEPKANFSLLISVARKIVGSSQR